MISPAALSFWSALLGDFEAPTPLINCAEREGVSPPGRGEQDIRLSVELTDRLREQAANHDLTLETLVQGAWALLLSRYSGEVDVVFGATRAGHHSGTSNAGNVVDVLMNTLPVRARPRADAPALTWLAEIRGQQLAVREYEQTPLVEVQRCSGVPAGTPLFESLIVFDSATLDGAVRAREGSWDRRTLRLLERTTHPLTVYAYAAPELLLKLAYDRPRFAEAAATRMLGHLEGVLGALAADPTFITAEIDILESAERREMVAGWNATETTFPERDCVHGQFEAQVRRSPDATAIIDPERKLTYAELNARANQFAHRLRAMGVGPDVRVGIFVARGIDLVVAMLAVLKAGGAYVPLDPEYPRDRLEFMVRDAALAVVLTQQALLGSLPLERPTTLCLDTDWHDVATESENDVRCDVESSNLAYVIYTSGSTGRPKGVMVEHRNVVNFFTAMDAVIPHHERRTWLAVTSESFDISVLELLWTLTRGFQVVIHVERGVRPAPIRGNTAIDFSLFYFAAGDAGAADDRYRLLTEGAKFADRHGFSAVWTPERHFHEFGALYPNPSVIGAALAVQTERLQIRAGSVVLPLHSPIRVAEEWAVVDNLSRGRVGLSFASGWQPNDFALAPANYARRKDVMLEGIDVVKRLWRGEAVAMPGPEGKEVEVRTFPRPVQAELPVWVTTAGNLETYRAAGRIGANLLTHLLGQTVEELGEKIAAYREARAAHGHAGAGVVSLMLHTFVAPDRDAVRELVRGPMTEYLRSSVSLIKNFVSSFPAFRGRPAAASGDELANLSADDLDALLQFAFERYFETSGLFGTPDECLAMVEHLRSIGVNDIACLIDFGVHPETVLANLPHLAAVRDRATTGLAAAPDSSLAAQLQRHGVTHLQCTPSLAKLLLADSETRAALASLRTVLVGGEALTESIAKDLRSATGATLINMYGPTETTVWSSCHVIDGAAGAVPIGRPIANTQMYVLDDQLRPVPAGVAGELYIGGAGVVRGYLDRPELTAERFVADRFSCRTGSRLYRTGDRVRYRLDGVLEFLGRTDQQVKIRGHRIELAEIEAIMRTHTGVGEAVVVVSADSGGEPRLVAYVVSSTIIDAGKLRQFVGQKLPSALVPSVVVQLDQLPLTPNGKLDRRSLPRPEHQQTEQIRPFAPPRSPVEQLLADVWRQVLSIENIGIADNFFELGGNSLSTIQLASRIRNVFGVDLPLRTFFEVPTIGALSGVIEARLVEQASDDVLETLVRELDQLSDNEALALTAAESGAARASRSVT